GSKPIKATCIGKGSLTKQGVEIDVEKVSILTKRRSKTVVEQVGQSEEVANKVNSEETKKDDEEEPMVEEDHIVLSLVVEHTKKELITQ
nr:hypothetical protein [Tanacetum cinerariifolium]